MKIKKKNFKSRHLITLVELILNIHILLGLVKYFYNDNIIGGKMRRLIRTYIFMITSEKKLIKNKIFSFFFSKLFGEKSKKIT